ncbi:hypothetical protein QFZ34_002215 [Phyllobacterium ifriqiyense]|uniref:Uncharacterized protein n=1 Tax=Phyllobacterium ifriqiyense TaxID=314238 RepID=A0ABU0S8E8_9HYPH|nr:hypothetical protein [Phyllobacterium ifriqiyense]MDQ0997033.1 hypothetical protein [Phyllobacterium ifriqiyense]
MKGSVVSENNPTTNRSDVNKFRDQMRTPGFREALRSAKAPIPTNKRFEVLLVRLEEAEKKQK